MGAQSVATDDCQALIDYRHLDGYRGVRAKRLSAPLMFTCGSD
ncbi:hypothetical protein ACIO8G_35205 [Streptomyces sp. NPDC087219]